MSSSDRDEDRLDALFHALADRTRRALLERLATGPSRISDLAEPFDMSLPAISKHIKVLEQAGLIERAIDGRVHRCSLQAAPMEQGRSWLERYREFWEGSLESVARFLEEKENKR